MASQQFFSLNSIIDTNIKCSGNFILSIGKFDELLKTKWPLLYSTPLNMQLPVSSQYNYLMFYTDDYKKRIEKFKDEVKKYGNCINVIDHKRVTRLAYNGYSEKDSLFIYYYGEEGVRFHFYSIDSEKVQYHDSNTANKFYSFKYDPIRLYDSSLHILNFDVLIGIRMPGYYFTYICKKHEELIKEKHPYLFTVELNQKRMGEDYPYYIFYTDDFNYEVRYYKTRNAFINVSKHMEKALQHGYDSYYITLAHRRIEFSCVINGKKIRKSYEFSTFPVEIHDETLPEIESEEEKPLEIINGIPVYSFEGFFARQMTKVENAHLIDKIKDKDEITHKIKKSKLNTYKCDTCDHTYNSDFFKHCDECDKCIYLGKHGDNPKCEHFKVLYGSGYENAKLDRILDKFICTTCKL